VILLTPNSQRLRFGFALRRFGIFVSPCVAGKRNAAREHGRGDAHQAGVGSALFAAASLHRVLQLAVLALDLLASLALAYFGHRSSSLL